MKLVDITKRAGRSIRQAKARTLLTSLAIGVGAFTITLALAAGAGGRQYAQDIISANTNAQELQVAQKQDFDTSKPQEYSPNPTIRYGRGFTVKQLSQADIDKIAKVDGVASVTPAYNLDVQYVTRSAQKKYQATVETFNPSIQLNYLAGHSGTLGNRQIVIPNTFSSALGFASAKQAIGQTIDVVVAKGASQAPQGDSQTYHFTVVGVTDKNALAVSSNNSLFVSEAAAKELYTYSTQGTKTYGFYTSATVIAKDGQNTDILKDRLTKLGYQAQTAKDLLSTVFQFINVLQGILLGFGVLAVLTSVFGIINTQYISVLERTQQIGLMKALGMRRRDVGRLFKLEAAWIGLLGGVIGAGLAILAGTLANPWITQTLSLSKGTDLLIFEPLSVFVIILGLMLVSVGAGILPARKAAKLDPIEALRTE